MLHDVGDEFERRNLWLQALLGSLSWSAQLDEVLDRHAPAHRGATDKDVSDAERPFLEAVLGVIALSERVKRLAEHAARTQPPAEVETGEAVIKAQRGILR